MSRPWTGPSRGDPERMKAHGTDVVVRSRAATSARPALRTRSATIERADEADAERAQRAPTSHARIEHRDVDADKLCEAAGVHGLSCGEPRKAVVGTADATQGSRSTRRITDATLECAGKQQDAHIWHATNAISLVFDSFHTRGRTELRVQSQPTIRRSELAEARVRTGGQRLACRHKSTAGRGRLQAQVKSGGGEPAGHGHIPDGRRLSWKQSNCICWS
jgi:hypothetical protein